ncbi:MAG: chemotaxis protein CheW [Syntrophomonadaceae bacterium]|jgi:purine-binding chemotaxis protein CheW
MGDQKERQIVVFFLHVNGEKVEFGVSIDKVQEINKMMEITRLPQTPEFIRGIASLRGKIIPIIDLKLRLNMETDTHYYDDAHIVVLEIGQHRTGVIVDGITEVMRLKNELIEPPPPVLAGITKDYLTGVAKLNDRLITLLDLEKLFSPEEKESLETASLSEKKLAI